MSRHRNVRSMNYSDEYDSYDDVYGHSVEDDSCISPSDAAFMYDRSNQQTKISAFLTEEEDIAEEDEEVEHVGRRQSDSFQYPQLSDVDEARLRSCLDEIHSVIGDSISENIVVETILQKNFDLAKSLDSLLASSSSNQTNKEEPKPQRIRRPRIVEKDFLNFKNKMESSPNNDSGEFLSNMTKKCLNINKKLEKDDYLSDECTKHNIRSDPENQYRIGSTSKKEILESKPSKPTVLLSSNLSSEEDDCSDNDTSLAALLAKHKTAKSITKESQITDYKSNILNEPVVAKNKVDSNSESSDDESFSLHMLASKYKSSQTTGSSIKITSPSIISAESTKLKEFKSSKIEKNDNIMEGTLKMDYIQRNPVEVVDKLDGKIISKFVAATFSDDSDSDEGMSLAGLVTIQSRNTKKPETGFDGDIRHIKPRELVMVASSHRHHTKSESDCFSPICHSMSDNLKKGFENETSNSLDSLKGEGRMGKDFQFSLGCTIPNSFKSKNVTSGLTSSLKSLLTDQTSTNYSQSDPDVSIMSSPASKTSKDDVLDQIFSTYSNDVEFGGINLSSAIKIPSNVKTSNSTLPEINAENELQDMEIRTLLDHLSVEEDSDEKGDDKEKMELDCMYDASHILKLKVKLRTRKCSSFGKVICRNWKPVSAPYIKKEKLNTTVIPFTFSTMSPDDEVESYLKKRD